MYERELNSENLCEDAQIICVQIRTKLTSEILGKFKNLKMIATRSEGLDHIDLNYCKEKQIKVTNCASYGSQTIAEYTIGLMLCASRKIIDGANRTKNWNFSISDLQGIDLENKTLGIIGTGKIGLKVIKIAKAFGMKIIAFDEYRKEYESKILGFKYTQTLEELLNDSDIISIHIPSNEKTKHLINAKSLKEFKKGVVLINTARGQVVESQAILAGLNKEIFSKVALDVFEEESVINNKDSEVLAELKLEIIKQIINHPNAIVTNHNAFNTKQALERLALISSKNIIEMENEVKTSNSVC